MAKRATLRASDSDRDGVAERLRQAAAEGRLLTEELESRLGVAFSARTYGELDPLVADLPSASDGRRRRRHRITPLRVAIGVAAVLVALAVIAALAALLAGLLATWLVWVLAAWFFFGHTGRGGWHRHRRQSRWRDGRPPSEVLGR